MGDQGRNVGGEEVLPETQAHYEGSGHTDSEDRVGEIGADYAQGVGSLEAGHGLHDRGLEISAVAVFYQVGDDFGVGLADEDVALGAQLLLDSGKVLDDAVVHYGKAAVSADVGVGVDVVGGPVGRPAGVAYAGKTAYGAAVVRHLEQVGEPSLSLRDSDYTIIQDGDARGIVAAVLHLAEAVKKYGGSVLRTAVAYYSAHGVLLMMLSLSGPTET